MVLRLGPGAPAWLTGSSESATTNAPLLSRSSSVGSINGLVIPDCVKEGPSARTTTFAAPRFCPTMNPEMRTFVPVWTEARPLMFANREVDVLSTS